MTRVALVCSAHGFGHTTRQLALAAALRRLGAEPVLFSAAPRALVDERLPGLELRPWWVDVGIAQRDSVHEDLPRTLALLAERCAEAAVDRLAAALAGFDRVVVDTAPAGLEAARRAGVPALAVGNFDWPWIYRHYPELSALAERLAHWQAAHVGLQITPGPGLSGFQAVERFGLLGKPSSPMRLASEGRTVLVSFGGFGLDAVDQLLPVMSGVTWVLAPPMLRLHRPDVIYAEGLPFPALVAGADAVLTKPGYSIFAEAALAGTPLVWISRGAFPEAPAIEAAMRERGDVKVGEGGVGQALEQVWSRPRAEPVDGGEADRLAGRVLRDTRG